MIGTVDLAVFPALAAEPIVRPERYQDDRDTGRPCQEHQAGAEPGAAAAEELARRAWEQSPSLTRPDGLLNHLTKTVLETARTSSWPSTRAMTGTARSTRRRERAHAICLVEELGEDRVDPVGGQQRGAVA